ncbi:MAG: NAD(P)/FAD-dependent oxidoreductase [Burkholderiales bacterium]|nr:NAD(P)/FAD-dependent oxidoreductase [Burkholderiales bacterium]
MGERSDFDLVVIGSGPGGYRAAVLGALRGLAVAIVERGVWGGTCLNRGCVPKKDWYHTARLVAGNRRYAARGLRGQLEPDLDAAWRHQRTVVETVRASYVDYLRRLGVRAFAGEARFVAADEIAVGDERLGARHAIVATGSRPFVPPWTPLVPGRVLTTDELFDAPPPPGARVGVVGSGVVGTEMAFILAMLGKDVVWLTQSAPLSRSRFSASARRFLGAALAAHGVAPRTGSRPERCVADDRGVTLHLPGGATERVDWLLLGAGRLPNVEGLGLQRAGVELGEDGFVAVDDEMRTSAPHVFAIGDCADAAMTSNHALVEAAIAVANIVAPGSRKRSDIMIPEVVYSAAELARLGLSEEEAEAMGLEPALGFSGFEASPAALAADEPQGFVRVVADHDTGRLLGAEAVGPNAGEWLQVVGPHAGSDEALAALARAAWNHPSFAEEILNAVETLASKWGLGPAVFGPPAGARE